MKKEVKELLIKSIDQISEIAKKAISLTETFSEIKKISSDDTEKENKKEETK